MKSKKLISLLCAAAMSASAFAGLTVTASAADSVLYSNNFNGFENNKMLVVARPSGDMPSTWIDAANGGNELFKALVNEQTPNEYTFTDADKATVLVKAGETNPDDTAIVYAYAKADDADDTYISLPKSRFSNKTGGMKLDLSSLKAADGEDLVVSFKAMLSATTDGETATFNVGSATGTPSLAATDLEAGTWGDVRLVVTSTGAATLYVNDEQKSTGTVDLSGGVTFWVDQYSGGTKKSDGIYARVNIDDLVVMSAAAGTGATVTVPAAKDPEDTTGPVVEQKQAAPSLIAPSSVTPVVNQKFDKAVNINSQTGDDGDTSIDGLKVVLGNVDDSVTGVSTSDYAKGDKVLKMTGGTKSTAGRGPIVSAVDTLPLSDDNSSVMTFAVNLGTTSSTGAGRLYILQSTRQAGSDNLGEYNAVMAALATDDYSYSNGDTSVAINNLDADTWYKVAIVVSSDKYRVWVAKADEDWSTSAQVQNDHVGQGESNLTVTELPMLAVTSSTATKSDGTAASNLTYSTVRIDNMLTYSGTASEPRRLLPTTEAAPTPAPIPAKVTMSVDETANTVTLTSDKDTDAVLVQASYRTDKTLDSVKKVVNVTLTAGTPYTVPAKDLDAFTTNDKIMVWDSLKTMTPLASAYTIKNGAAQATAKPAPTAEPTVAIATLENTATSGWGSNTAAATVNTESGLEHFNNDTDTSWAGTAFAQFTLPTLADGEGVAKAELIYNVKQGGAKSRTSKIFALTNGDIDLTTMTGAAADRFADARTLITSFNAEAGENALTTDVTAAVQGKSGKITLMFTDNAAGADLYGKASGDKAPVLKITKGKVVTFNVAAAANADTKVAGAKIVVKNGDTTVATITTNAEGTATTALSAGAYTYTVESNDYAIKKDGALTVADSVVAENVALTANAATTVEIANPATGTTLAQGEEATYTATVKDQDGRVMTATVDWTVVNSEDVAAENITVANGKVNVTEEATAGDYKVKATVNGTTVSSTADLKVIAAEKLNLSITSLDAKQGIVAYTVNGVASTDTQLNKGKKIVATATPAALYEFVGWVTSTENLITGTYVSTDAQYSFDLTANTTLIAVFKYNGIYYQNDYNNATESDWKSGNASRYTVSIAGDDDKYTQISAVATGNNGTSITSNAVQVDADKDYIAEFDLALTGANNQTSSFAVKAKDSGKYALVLQLKTAGSTTWTVNGTTEVTLEKGVLYHYTIEKVETGVKVTIAPTAGGDAVVDGVTYANDTATTGGFAGTISNAGLAGMQFNTARYYAGMQIDNVLVKAPAATSVTE